MREYFLIIDNKKIGPLSFDQLARYSIDTETLVWYKGLKDWEKAKNIEDFSDLIQGPPPIIIDRKLERKIITRNFFKSLTKSVLYSLIVPFLIFGISISAYKYSYYLNPNFDDVVWGDSRGMVQFGDHRNFVASAYYGTVEITFPVDLNGRPKEFVSKEAEREFCTYEFIRILNSRIYDYKNHILFISSVYSLIGFGVSILLMFIITFRKSRNK